LLDRANIGLRADLRNRVTDVALGDGGELDFGGGKHGKKENDAAGSGEKVSRERGPEFYREIGRKGGESRGNSKAKTKGSPDKKRS
jgi:general stress protein YciG